MKKFIEKGVATVKAVANKATDEISSGYSSVVEKINGLPVFMSLESSDTYSEIQYDEKHYFVVPFNLSEHKFTLHTMRCLPNGVPSINNLPKRRILHLPNDHYELMLKEYMKKSVAEIVKENHSDKSNPLESLANDIDALDKKLTYGMLVIGGIAAISNPLLGAGITAKALLPGVADLFNKYGLRPAGEKISKFQLEKAVKEAENDILKEFEAANTLRVVNPILEELELALRTTEKEHDPLTDFNIENGHIPQIDGERWRALTEKAICHTYKECFADPGLHEKAGLGPEDIRWLKMLYKIHNA